MPTDIDKVDGVVELGDMQSGLSIAPTAGARLMTWRVEGREILYWPDQYDLSEPAKIRGGNPLLFPFLGRHRVGELPNHWQDSEGVVRALPQHGFARDLPFAHTVSDDGQAITLTLTSDASTREGYPFEFVFQVTYRLEGNALDVIFDTRNTGDQPMPYYAGHHFYFALPRALRAESRLHLPPTRRCEQRADGSITPTQAEPADYWPGDPQIQDRFHLLGDTGLRRPVTLHTPSLGRTISITLDEPGTAPWYAVTTWTLADESDFYCVEPWLGLPNAIHHGQGLRWISPGQAEQARCRLHVRFDSQ